MGRRHPVLRLQRGGTPGRGADAGLRQGRARCALRPAGPVAKGGRPHGGRCARRPRTPQPGAQAQRVGWEALQQGPLRREAWRVLLAAGGRAERLSRAGLRRCWCGRPLPLPLPVVSGGRRGRGAGAAPQRAPQPGGGSARCTPAARGGERGGCSQVCGQRQQWRATDVHRPCMVGQAGKRCFALGHIRKQNTPDRSLHALAGGISRCHDCLGTSLGACRRVAVRAPSHAPTP